MPAAHALTGQPSLGECDGRLEDRSQLETAEALVGSQPAGQHAGHRSGAYVGVDLSQTRELRWIGRGWRGSQVIERVHRASRGFVDQHEAAATSDAGHERLDDPERRAHRHRAVDGGAAFEEHA